MVTLSSLSAIAQTRWAQQVGGNGSGNTHIAVDASNQVFMIGSTNGSIKLGSTAIGTTGATSSFIAKFDALGNTSWVQEITGTLTLSGVAIDAAGEAYTVGTFSGSIALGSQTITSQGTSDIVLLKFDSQGKLLWSRQGGSQQSGKLTGNGVVLDKQGNAYVVGALSGTVDWGGGSLTSESTTNIYLTSYTPQGSPRWAQQGGGKTSQSGGTALNIDGAGNVYIGGGFSGTAVFGTTAITNQTGFLLAKCDATGAFKWASVDGGAGALNGAAMFEMAVDEQGSVAMTGMVNENSPAVFGPYTLKSTGGHDGYVVKYDATGKVAWVSQATGPDTEYGTGVAFDKYGNVYATGIFASRPTRWSGTTSLLPVVGKNAYIIKYDAQGKILAAQREGACGGTYSQSIAVNANQEIYIAGSFNGFASFVSKVFEGTTAAGERFLAKVGDLSTPSTPNNFNCTSLAVSPPTPTPTPVPTPLPAPTPAPVPAPLALDLMVPNILTPNGDGLNDKLKITGLVDKLWALTIYNRWGQQVYQSAAYQQDWDAAALLAGTYYYHLRHASGREYKGWIAVAR